MNAETIIERLGGVGAVAKMCRITSAAVSQWKRDGIPPARRQYLELARPDAFAPQPNDRSAPPATHPESEAA
jgi:hypothetical protein